MKTDLTYLNSVSGGSEQLMLDMIQIFIEQVTEYAIIMKQYLAENNWIDLSRIAHKSKSAVAIMGMVTLSEKMKKLETQARDAKDTETYAETVDTFISETSEAIVELEEYIKSHK
jgi:HPt (histidine-containing phosphotransfer) domain-containing protein